MASTRPIVLLVLLAVASPAVMAHEGSDVGVMHEGDDSHAEPVSETKNQPAFAPLVTLGVIALVGALASGRRRRD